MMRKIFSLLLLMAATGMFCLTANANVRTWIGAGSGGTGLNLTDPLNWNGGSTLLTTDDYIMNLAPNASDGNYTIAQGTGITAFNSLNITFAATGTTQRTIDINLTSSFVITGVLTINNATSNGNVNHTISLNVNAGTLTCGAVNTNATGITTGFTYLNVNVKAGAALVCNGKWKSSELTGSTVYTYIKNSGTVTITDSTVLNNAGTTPLRLLVDNSPAQFNFNGNVKLGTTVKSEFSTGTGPNTVLLGGFSSTSTGSYMFNASNDTTIIGYNMGTENFKSGFFLFTGNGEVIFSYSQTGVPDRSPGTFQIGTAVPATVSYLLSTGANDALTVYNSLTVNNNSVFSVKAAIIPAEIGNKATIAVRAGATLNLGVKGGKSSSLPNNYLNYIFDSTSTINYNGDTQNVYAGAKYGNLTLSGTGVKTSNTSLYIAGNFLISGSATFDINDSTKTYADTLSGNWTNNSTDPSGGFISSGTGNVTVVFNGSSNTAIGGIAPSNFYNISISKNSAANTVDVTGNVSVSININPTTINTGILNINMGASFVKTTTTSGSISIGATAGISNKGGIFTLNSNGSVNNSGLFQNIAGTSSIGNSSGNTLTISGINTGKFDMQGGTLLIAGRLVNTTGTDSIKGGNIILNTIGNTSINTGSFNMSTGTNLSITGGTITFQNAGTGGYDLNILKGSGTKNITGGTIIFGNNSTPVSSTFQCYSPVPFYNLTIDQNAPVIKLANNLTINGSTILNSGILNINGDTLTLNGAISGAGTLSGSAISGLVIGGNAGTLKFTQAGIANYLKTLTINNAASLTLADSLNIVAGSGFGTVKADGILNSNGWLTLKSDLNGTARIDNSAGVINGKVTVERHIPQNRAWRLISVPVDADTLTIRTAWQEGVNNTDPSLNYANNKNPHPGYGTHITYDHNTANGYDYNTTTNPSLLTWVQSTNKWSTNAPPTISTKINAYDAYCIFVRGSRAVHLEYGSYAASDPAILRVTGKIYNNTWSKTFTGTVINDMLLVPNPFASSVNIASIISTTAGIFSNKFWVFDPANDADGRGVGGYVVYSKSGSMAMMVPMTTNYPSPTTVIQSSQAFFVQASAANAKISFSQADKTPAQTNVFGRQAAPQNLAVYTNLMTQGDSGLALVDGVGAGFGKGFSAAVDEHDAAKLWNFNENIALVRNTSTLSIEFRPIPVLTDTLFFRLYLRQQPYTLKIFLQNPSNALPLKGWIVDNYLQTKTEISLQDTTLYSFTPNPDTMSYRNRFMLVINRQLTTTPVPVSKITDQANPGITGIAASAVTPADGISVYPNPAVSAGRLSVKLTGMAKGTYHAFVYDATAQKLADWIIIHNGGNATYRFPLDASWAAGVYAVNILDNNSGKTMHTQLIIHKQTTVQ